MEKIVLSEEIENFYELHQPFIFGNWVASCNGKRFIINRRKIIASVLLIVICFNCVKVIPHNLQIYMVDVGQRRLLCFKESIREKYYY